MLLEIEIIESGYPRHRENREKWPKSLSGKTQEIWKFYQNTGKTQGIRKYNLSGYPVEYNTI